MTQTTVLAPAVRRDPPHPDTLVPYQRARRDRIVGAALELMLGRTYDALQMKDVALAADVALGTIYRYFRSKDHLCAEALLRWSERFARETTGRPGPSGERLKVAFRRAARAFERNPSVLSYLTALQSTGDPLAAELYEHFASRQREAFATYVPRVASPRREKIVMVMSAVLDAALRDFTRGRKPISSVYSAIDDAADLVVG